MALIQQIVLDKYEVVGQYKFIHCREDRRIIDEDTNEIMASGNFHRHVLAPGDDVSNEPAEIQAIAGIIWTQEVLDAYDAYVAENG